MKTEWNTETAEWYAEQYGDYPTNRLAVNEIDIADGSIIIDIGCGTGSALRHVSTKIKDGSLVGIDPVPRMIEIARELTEHHTSKCSITFKIGSAEDIPLKDDLADIVFAFDSIDHWQNIDKGLEEIGRIIKLGGKLIVVKDLSVPGSKKSLKKLAAKLRDSGFSCLEQREIKSDDVKFYLIILKFTD